MKKLTDIFFRGLFSLLPIVITLYILYSGVVILENILGSFLRTLLGDTYIPGLGLIFAGVTVFLFGLLMTSFISKSIWFQIENRFKQVPLIKTVYAPLKDLMGLFSNKDKNDLKSVVLVEIANGSQVLGLVTRDNFEDIDGLTHNHKVAVYLPLSYALGGFTLLVEKEKVQKINLPVERALSLAITGWVKSSDDEDSVDYSNQESQGSQRDQGK